MPPSDSVVYYRLTDGVVIGSTASAGHIQAEQEVAHYGKGHGWLRLPGGQLTTPHHRARVVAGALVETPDPEEAPQQAARQSGLLKLQTSCALSNRELNALFGKG